MRTIEMEKNKFQNLSTTQRGLYSYYLIEGQVSNGGFVQAIYNGYEEYMDDAIDILGRIGQADCQQIVIQAQKIGKRKRVSFFIARLKGLKGLFNPDFYEKNITLDQLDDEFYKHTKLNDDLFRAFIWENRHALMSDDSIPIPEEDEITRTYFSSGETHQEFRLVEKGILGWYHENYENGSQKVKKQYLDGTYTGESEEYSENGTLQLKTYMAGKKLIEEKYDESERKISLKTKNFATGKDDGEYFHWHENGEMKSQGFKRGYLGYGVTKSYYDNGQLKRLGMAKGYDLIIDEFYLVDGTQTLKEGKGYTEVVMTLGGVEKTLVSEYLKGVRHGEYKKIVNGEVEEFEKYKNGNLVR
ncbi:MAG: DUF4375 domain-containing protein [Lewinella sp.]